MNRCLFLLVTLLAIACAPAPKAEQVVVSVHPLALAIEQVAPKQVTVSSLIPPGASPHTYQLRPTQIMQLGNVKTVYWINPGIETGLGKQLAKRDNAKQLHRGEITDHGDMHMWLDPAWVLSVLETIVAEQNWPTEPLEQLKATINDEQTLWQQSTEALGDMPIVVAHDAYNHWRAWAPFNQVAVVQPSAEHPAPAAHLFEVDQLLQGLNHSCILIEPTTPERTRRFLTAYDLPLVTIDIVGRQATSYVQLMQSIASQLATCAKGL